jgi:hypothetical protein
VRAAEEEENSDLMFIYLFSHAQQPPDTNNIKNKKNIIYF